MWLLSYQQAFFLIVKTDVIWFLYFITDNKKIIDFNIGK